MKKSTLITAVAIGVTFSALSTGFAATNSAQSASAQQDAYNAYHWLQKNGKDKPSDTMSAYAGTNWFQSVSFTAADVNGYKTSSDDAKLILALLASGQDPHHYLGQDFVQELAKLQIKSGPDAGKFADNLDGTGTDSIPGQAFDILALESAGGVTYDRDAAAKWLLSHQQKDGGYSYSASSTMEDPDDTAFVLDALAALGYTQGSPVVQSTFSFLKSKQAADGGFGSPDATGVVASSNSDSTGVTIDALTALGVDPSTWQQKSGTPVSALMADIDSTTGGFKYDNTGGQWSGVNEFSTKDGLTGLGAIISGKSVYQRLHWTNLGYLNAYWAQVKARGGAWINHQWHAWSQLQGVAVSGSYYSALNPYWKAVIAHGGAYVNHRWCGWNTNSFLADKALAAAFGQDSLAVNHLV